MKKPLEIKKRYIHLGFIALLVLSGIMDWVNVFAVGNLLYALYLAVLFVRHGRGNSTGKWKVFETVFLSIGAAFLVPFMLIPSWVFGVTYSFRYPDIEENIPEYRFSNVVLKDAAKFYNYNSFAVEGTLSEEDLRKLAKNENWQLQEIKAPAQVFVTASNMIKNHRTKEYDTGPVTVKNGYHYSTYNGTDSGVMFTWCKATNKFYFYTSSR